MNLFFVFGSGENARLLTPELTGTLLPGITRDSLLTVARDLGYPVERGDFTDEWREAAVGSPRCSLRYCRRHYPVGT